MSGIASKGSSTRALLRSPFAVVTLAIVTWFVITFLVWPNLILLKQVFIPEGSPTGEIFSKLFKSERAMASLRNSFLLAVVLSVTVNVVGTFIVLVTRYFDIRGRRVLFAGFATTLLYGGVVMVSGWNLIYGKNGFITRFLTGYFPDLDPAWFSGLPAVVVVSTLAGTGFHLLFMTSALSKVDFQTVEAAQQLARTVHGSVA